MSYLKSIGALALAAGIAVGATGSASAVERLKASVHLPPKNNTVADGYEPFVKRVEEGTNGEVKIRLFLGGSLLGPKAASEGIRDGVVDLGYVIVGYHPAEFPYTAFLGDMAAFGTNPITVSAATTEMLFNCPECLQEYKDRGNVYTGTYAVPAMVLMSTKMINSPEDLKGIKIRAAGGVWDRYANAVGATAVNVPSSEQYEALSRGVVDASLHVASSMKTYGLWDMVKDVVKVNVGVYRAINTFAFNPKSWAGLTADQRKVVLNAAADSNLDIAIAYVKGGDEALSESAAKGIRIQEMSPELQKVTDAFVAKEASELIATGKEKRGIDNPEKYVKTMQDLVKKWDAIFAEVGGDGEKFKARFREDVIAKIDASKYGL